jgi:hypothetical protein
MREERCRGRSLAGTDRARLTCIGRAAGGGGVSAGNRQPRRALPRGNGDLELRKGAALDAIQICETPHERGLVRARAVA